METLTWPAAFVIVGVAFAFAGTVSCLAWQFFRTIRQVDGGDNP